MTKRQAFEFEGRATVSYDYAKNDKSKVEILVFHINICDLDIEGS